MRRFQFKDFFHLRIKRSRGVVPPPGSRLNTFAQAFYSKKTYERIFQQCVIDWREAHALALSRKQYSLAHWKHFSGYCTFVSTMVMHAVSTVMRSFMKVWRATGGG